MRRFRPTAADQPLLDELATVGIAPGARKPSRNRRLGDATLAGLRDAVAAGRARVGEIVKERFAAGFAAHNGYLVEPVGNYGTDYDLRALVDQVGLGALPKNVAVYPVAQTDRLGAPLSGAKRYVLHFNGPANPVLPQLPIPADAFWSVTMYDSSGFFVPNALDRWLINDRSDLHYNADGSLDIYIQPDAPSDPDQRKNWLPSPADAPFRMVTRLYAPPADKIAGILDGTAWKSGTILPCASGATPAFPPSGISAPIACAPRHPDASNCARLRYSPLGRYSPITSASVPGRVTLAIVGANDGSGTWLRRISMPARGLTTPSPSVP